MLLMASKYQADRNVSESCTEKNIPVLYVKTCCVSSESLYMYSIRAGPSDQSLADLEVWMMTDRH